MSEMRRPFEQSVQTNAPESKDSLHWTGYDRFTLKTFVEIVFTLLIPVMIGILAVVLQKNESELTEKNRKNDYLIGQLQRQSDEEQTRLLGNETVFSNYVKNMADVILFGPTKLENQHFIVTRALTSTVLRQLDLEKKRLVIQFLYDTGILHRGENIFATNIALDADRHLKGVILDKVDFSNGLDLSAILLREVRLVEATFARSNLQAADLSASILSRVNFSGTNCDRAKFVNAQLDQTDFTGASLEDVQFTRANLSGSKITDEQIQRALFVFRTILPNGTWARSRTFVQNGDAKDGMNGWNVTEGVVQAIGSSFTGSHNSTMIQRINTTKARDYAAYGSFEYCFSMLVDRPEGLIVEVTHRDWKMIVLRVDQFVRPAEATCNDSPTGTDFLDLQILFLAENSIAVRNIELTLSVT